MKVILMILALGCFQLAQAQMDIDHPESLSHSEKVELLWAQYLVGELEPVGFFTWTENIKSTDLSKSDRLRLTQMRNTFLGNQKSLMYYDELSEKLALRIAAEQKYFGNIGFRFSEAASRSLEGARKRLAQVEEFRPKTEEEIVELVFESPDLAGYQNAGYTGGVKLFLFCRHDRSYPCMFVMKDSFDSLVRNEDESLWTLPALAKSAGNLPYYVTNGHTPSGVHSIDSVMPEANRQMAFGKFRRVILNWIPKDEDVVNLLPKSAVYRRWWKEASLARDNGRKWLRIHGTGRTNDKPESTYYPHMPTSGCVSVREGKYGEIVYKDQRLMLDMLMSAMELAPVFENEPKVKGMLYVIELDDKKEKVTAETLKEYGVY